eukprot:TRINITY_DN4248_c0_g1_i2.p1 TRINITY_DN4248_c0_g1~~TRINITY_DN4248_c0_g1_i2.p1  ORF type:complete len:267 (-),score=64.37 TRINITY_DN4248_c0_g1_i2:29-829(-)
MLSNIVCGSSKLLLARAVRKQASSRVVTARRSFSRWDYIDSDKWVKEHKDFMSKLHALIQTHNALDAEKFLTEMKSYGARPDPAVYQELIRVYAEKDKLADLEKAIAELEEKKIRPSQFMFDRLIHLYAKHKESNGIKKTLKRMESLGLEPNQETWTEVISAFATMGAEGDALRTFEHVRRLGQANAHQYAIIFTMLAKHHDWINIKTLWNEYEHGTLKPTEVLCNLMLRIADKMKDEDLKAQVQGAMRFYNYSVKTGKLHALDDI